MATGNWTDPNCGQLQLVVRSFAVGFSSVSVIFSVQWTGPANTSCYTIWTMQKHHISSWQVNGRWRWWRGTSTNIWQWQHHVKHPQPIPTVPFLTTKQVPHHLHGNYRHHLFRQQMTNDNNDWLQPQPQQMTTTPQRRHDDTMWWDNNTKTWQWCNHNNTPPMNGTNSDEHPTPPPRDQHWGPSTTAHQWWGAPNTTPHQWWGVPTTHQRQGP